MCVCVCVVQTAARVASSAIEGAYACLQALVGDKSARVRYRALLLIDYLFRRSALFRRHLEDWYKVGWLKSRCVAGVTQLPVAHAGRTCLCVCSVPILRSLCHGRRRSAEPLWYV